MTLKWITPSGEILNDYEEQVIKDVNIEFEPYDASLTLISGALPEGITLDKVKDGCYILNGVLPIVGQQTDYYFTLRLSKDSEFLDRYFVITVKNKTVQWNDSQEFKISILETTYASIQLQLKNAIGNEQFIKVSGSLPKGLILNSSGLIYGNVEAINGDENQEYKCQIGIAGHDDLIKDFTFTVQKVSSASEPIWITEEGDLGNINHNRSSNLLVKAYDINGRPISYRLKSGTLPTGLSLNESNGRIEGVLSSKQIHEWNFVVVVENGLKEIARRFSIRTNSVLAEDDIQWISNGSIGNCSIGENVKIVLETQSQHKVHYKLISNTLPRGLSLTSDGQIVGCVTYQELKEYSFIVEANNGYKSVLNELKINVIKGLGFNAVQCYYYINHENDNEYNELVSTFDASSAYSSTNSLLSISPYPEIDICTLTCFDKTLIAILFDQPTPISMVWGKTIKKDYVQDGEIVYSAFYKSVVEESYPRYFEDKSYITTKIKVTTNDLREVLSQPIYVYKNEYDHVLYDTSTQKIISESNEYPEYMLKWDSVLNEYYTEYNGEKKYVDVFTTDENGERKQVYTKVQNETWFENIDCISTDYEANYDSGNSDITKFSQIIDANTDEQYRLYPVRLFVEYLNTDVDYKQYLVYDKDSHTLQEDIIFTLDWNPLSKFIIKEGKVCHISSIDKPWMFKSSENESFGLKDDIVLPYISDEDVCDIDTKPFIKFFDKDLEVLPEWKTVTVDMWQHNTQYIVGDVFMYNGFYYRVIKAFISTETFDDSNEFISEHLVRLSDSETQYYNEPQYFPSLNLFYAKPGTNVEALKSLNNAIQTGIEDKGGYWTGRKFIFYEVHFKPLYNSNIDNFAITFYNHKDEKIPQFQLI